MSGSYIPDSGDIVYVDLGEPIGHEQGGKRPVLVTSPRAYNQKSKLFRGVPLTTKIKGYPFEVPITSAPQKCVALADQGRPFDWEARAVELQGVVTREELESVRAKAKALLKD